MIKFIKNEALGCLLDGSLAIGIVSVMIVAALICASL